MINEVLAFLGAERFQAHSICLTNEPSMVFMFTTSHIVIAVSYFLIGWSLWRRAKRHGYIQLDIQSGVLYGLFIFLCGMSHFMATITMYTGIYRLEVINLAATAVVSAITAYLTFTEEVPIAVAE